MYFYYLPEACRGADRGDISDKVACNFRRTLTSPSRPASERNHTGSRHNFPRRRNIYTRARIPEDGGGGGVGGGGGSCVAYETCLFAKFHPPALPGRIINRRFA